MKSKIHELIPAFKKVVSKKIIFPLLVVCMSAACLPNEAKAAPDSLRTQTTIPAAEAQVMIDRLKEIESIDQSTLSKTEKKALKKEVRSIDRQLRGFSGGVYISAGTLIIILILLILLT